MLYKDVDIYLCKFFIVDSDGQLEFSAGKFKGKKKEDFNNLPDILACFNYCCWIMKKEDIPNVSKFCALSFINDIMPKMRSFEKLMKEVVVKQQREAKKKTEQAVKQTGRKYV